MKPAPALHKKITRGSESGSGYEQDFYAWLLSQVSALGERRFRDLDIENLIEEVEGLAGSLLRELRSRLRIVLVHLLKWRYQPEKRSTSWTITLLEQRDQIEDLLNQSPSLRRLIPESMEKAYRSATKRAALEMRRTNIQHIFPAECPWTIEQILDEDYLPNGSRTRG
jgi:hypothetical protein